MRQHVALFSYLDLVEMRVFLCLFPCVSVTTSHNCDDAGGRERSTHTRLARTLSTVEKQPKNRHENIVRSHGSSIKGKQMYIFLEYMPGGSIRLLLDRFGVFEEKISLLYAKQVSRGLSFLHARGIAHRDVKVRACVPQVSPGG